MSNPLNQLAKLRRFYKGDDPTKYLSEYMHQNLKAIESAFQSISQTVDSSASLQESLGWVLQGAITVTGTVSNPVKGSVAKDELWLRKDGPDLVGRINFSQTSGSGSGSGFYLLKIPESIGEINIKVTDVSDSSTPTVAISKALVGVSNLTGPQTMTATVHVYDKNNLRISGFWDDSSFQNWGSTYLAFGAVLNLTAEFRVPIVGWT